MKCVWLVMLVACSAPHEDVDRPAPAPIAPKPSSPTSTCGSAGTTTTPSPVAQLVAGPHYTCARLDDRSVWCWGARGHGQVDNDVLGPQPCAIATRVDQLAGAMKIVGDCTLRADDTMLCADIERRRFDTPVPIPASVRGLDEEVATASGTCGRRGAKR